MLKINQNQIIKHFNNVTLFDVLSAMEQRKLQAVDIDEDNQLLFFKFSDVTRIFGTPETHDILFEMIDIEADKKRRTLNVRAEDLSAADLKNMISNHETNLNKKLSLLSDDNPEQNVDLMEDAVVDIINLSANLEVMCERLEKRYGSKNG